MPVFSFVQDYTSEHAKEKSQTKRPQKKPPQGMNRAGAFDLSTVIWWS